MNVGAVNILCFTAELKISGGAESTEGRNIGSTKNMWKERGKRKGLLRVLMRQQKGTRKIYGKTERRNASEGS